MPKRFTLDEAQSLIPEVDRLLREAISLKSDYQDAERAVQSFNERVMLMGGVLLKREEILAAKQRRDAAAGRLRVSIESVQELGCVVKDLDIGLIDFPTVFRGVEVYLCWKLGEPAIAFWHGLDEGFRGRKAIDEDFREHHRGDHRQ
ncbi:MAG TPA: DUF2203 domain-containing protein [Bryobacteraceae bacterium]|jgi:hypothetical protein